MSITVSIYGFFKSNSYDMMKLFSKVFEISISLFIEFIVLIEEFILDIYYIFIGWLKYLFLSYFYGYENIEFLNYLLLIDFY